MRAGKASLEKLNELGAQLADAKEREKVAKVDQERIRKEMVDLVGRYELPIAEGQSTYANVDHGYVRVTRPEAPTPKPRPAVLLEILRSHYPRPEADRLFFDVVVLPKTCDIDTTKWNEHQRGELVKDAWLMEALEADRQAPRPSVHFELGKQKEVD